VRESALNATRTGRERAGVVRRRGLAIRSLNVMAERILIVDDEPAIVSTLAEITRRAGYTSAVALSGEQALQKAAEFGPDVLITDYAMPGMNGFELAAKIARQYPGCRLFLLSAYNSLGDSPKVPRQPPLKLLLKPIPPQELLEVIARPELPIEPSSPVILNVDDVESHRYSISRLLSHRGLVIIEAATGVEALEKLKARPDAILLDINLPDMNGFEVCRRIRAADNNSGVPVLHFTATYHNAEAASESRAAGADAFIEQPVDPDELVITIRRMIQKHYLEASCAN
jgi:CheY-like chemotaxis protein